MPAEQAAVEAARDGDRDAFAGLYQRYVGMVHAIILARVPAGDAGDLVQDVFVTALDAIADLRDAGAVGPWLATIARRRAAAFYRGRRPTESLSAELPGGGTPSPEAIAAIAAIRRLPDAYRETLLMRLVAGMTGPEIAEQTGLTPGSVRVNLYRGMQLLRAALEEEP